MWARVVEVMLGCWLLVSPFVFRDTPHVSAFWTTDVATGCAAIVCSLAAFARPLARAHLLTGAAGVWLIASGYFSMPRPGPPAAQNEIVIGLLLAMLAVVPTEASRPPAPWRPRHRR
jgi:hypothetical protein